MTKLILKDKLSFPLGFSLTWGVLNIKNYDNYLILLGLTIALFLFISLITLTKKDNYIYKTIFDKGLIKITYQQNLDGKQPVEFNLRLDSVKSFNFSSKSFFDFTHEIKVKFLEDYEKSDAITLRTSDKSTFIKILSALEEYESQISANNIKTNTED